MEGAELRLCVLRPEEAALFILPSQEQWRHRHRPPETLAGSSSAEAETEDQ